MRFYAVAESKKIKNYLSSTGLNINRSIIMVYLRYSLVFIIIFECEKNLKNSLQVATYRNSLVKRAECLFQVA